jgi:hypothetical protein
LTPGAAASTQTEQCHSLQRTGSSLLLLVPDGLKQQLQQVAGKATNQSDGDQRWPAPDDRIHAIAVVGAVVPTSAFVA